MGVSRLICYGWALDGGERLSKKEKFKDVVDRGNRKREERGTGKRTQREKNPIVLRGSGRKGSQETKTKLVKRGL